MFEFLPELLEKSYSTEELQNYINELAERQDTPSILL